MTFEQELWKAALQVGLTGFVAIFGAWLGVRWGLRNYKAQKLYDRQLDAMAALLSALREMSRILEIWIPAEQQMRDLWKPYADSLTERYSAASSKFEEVSSYAVLILPHEAANRVFNLEDQLGKIEFETYAQEYEERLYLISKALTWLTDYAKRFRQP